MIQISDELKIKMFTDAGRLIRVIKLKSTKLNYNFSEVFWNSRYQGGDLLGNGVCLYKIIAQKGSEVKTKTQRLAIVR